MLHVYFLRVYHFSKIHVCLLCHVYRNARAILSNFKSTNIDNKVSWKNYVNAYRFYITLQNIIEYLFQTAINFVSQLSKYTKLFTLFKCFTPRQRTARAYIMQVVDLKTKRTNDHAPHKRRT